MKILYDYQAFQMQKIGGVSNCFAELISNLPKSVDWEIGLKQSDNIHLRDKKLITDLKHNSLTSENFISNKHYLGKGTLFKFLNEHFKCFPSSEHINRKHSIKLLKEQNFDIFHPTFFDPYFLPYLGSKPFVLTIHDFITDKFRQDDKQTFWRKILAPKAAQIIAVSETTKLDAINILKVPRQKISVIYHGVSIPHDTTYNRIVDGNYFLFVGRRQTYKNFKPMVKAMAKFLNANSNYKLVCTAGDFDKEETDLFKKLGVRNQIIHVFASYDELLSLYKYAKAFIFPSLYEGFGIPILEAYAMQCPVMLSEESCFPEIAGDAALYFRLNEKENTLSDLLIKFSKMSQSDITQLIKKQNKQLQKYSWKKSAQQLAEVYKEVLHSHGKL